MGPSRPGQDRSSSGARSCPRSWEVARPKKDRVLVWLFEVVGESKKSRFRGPGPVNEQFESELKN